MKNKPPLLTIEEAQAQGLWFVSKKYGYGWVPITWQGFDSKGPTIIGDNVWLGANVVVTSGVRIGARSVIGANSVVTTDVPPGSIAAGAPARVMRAIAFRGGEPAPGAETAAG